MDPFPFKFAPTGHPIWIVFVAILGLLINVAFWVVSAFIIAWGATKGYYVAK